MSKGILRWPGFELDGELYEGRIKHLPLLGKTVVVIYRAVGFTGVREIIARGCVCRVMHVEQHESFKIWLGNLNLKRPD